MELDQNYNPAVETIETVSPTRLRKTIAKWVSRICSPPILIVISIALTAAAIGTSAAWLWAGFFTLVAVGLPVLQIVWLVRRGLVTDFHIRIREQRKGPMVFMSLMSVLAAGVLALFSAPVPLLIMALSAVTLTTLLTVITCKWKISGHSTTAAGFSILMVGMFGALALPALLLIPLVAWARIARSRHELSQTIAGSLVGITYAVIVLAVVASNGYSLLLI